MKPVKIIKGAPIPRSKKSGRPIGTSTKYPFRTMNPGESFMVTTAERCSVYASARAQLGGNGRITVRQTGPDKHQVWLLPEPAVGNDDPFEKGKRG